jgi:transmembrane protein 222
VVQNLGMVSYQEKPEKVRVHCEIFFADAVDKASNEYCKRMHNLFFDNCHSHCGMALSLMRYGGSTSWNMIRLAAWMFLFGKYVSFMGFVKTWLPFIIIAASIYGIYHFT